MNKTILTLLFVILTLTFCNAQKIEIKKVFGGYKYTQNGVKLSLSELNSTLKLNKESSELFKKAKLSGVFGVVLSGIGGGLIGYPIGTSIGGGEPNWTLAGIGVGFIAVGVPLAIKGDKKVKQAVELYNSSLNSTSHYEFKPKFKIIVNEKGIGLSMSF